jgi:pimeloyl-ACP methyl ester carboxylesterase
MPFVSSRRSLTACLVGLSVALGACSFSQPSSGWRSLNLALPADSDKVRSLELDWTDTQRNRPVPARLHLPRNVQGQSPLPLVVVSHGLGGSRAGYSHLGRFWAENGFAVLHVQHNGSDREVWMANPLGVLMNLQKAASEENAKARAQDVSFAISQLERELASAPGRLGVSLGVSINTQQVLIAGHSYGANTAMLLAGARVVRNDTVLDLHDNRISAAILMSSPPFYGEFDAKPILSAVHIPTLHLTGSEDVIRVPGYYSAPKDRVAIYNDMPAGKKFLVVFQNATHSIFTDRIDNSGPELNAAVKAATRVLTLDFLRAWAPQPSAQENQFGIVFDRAVQQQGKLIAQAQRD